MRTAKEILRATQANWGIDEDGIAGPITDATYSSLKAAVASNPDQPWPSSSPVVASQTAGSVSQGGASHTGFATSFADPADISAFRACKAEGKTDEQCFAVGDNGIGKWGDATGPGTGPGCALPPEDWEQFGSSARGKLVIVTGNDRSVTVKLVDTMPHKANIHNGAIIDLTTDTVRALGWEPPLKETVSWRWA